MPRAPEKLTLRVVLGIPLIGSGDDLAAIMIAAIEKGRFVAARGRYRRCGLEGGVKGARALRQP
jgi:hypothetical protein